jgi:hypothetical protein
MKKYLVLSFVLIVILFNQAVSKDINKYNSESLYRYRDLGVIDILVPDTIYSDSIIVGLWIGNIGTTNEFGIPLIFYIVGTSYSTTQFVSLTAGSSCIIYVDNFIGNVPYETVAVFVCTLAINDTNPANDFKRKTVVILPSGIKGELPSIGTIQVNKPTIMNVSDFKSEYQDKSVFIYEPSGRLVSLRNLKLGIYFVKITDKDKVITRKVMLIRE